MRVLLVSDFYPPHTGGMEGHVRALAHGLRAEGHEVIVAATEREDGLDMHEGIQVHRLKGLYQRMTFAFADSDRMYPPPAIDPELSMKLHALIGKVRPDVIHAHGWVVYSALAANALHQVPFVNTMHDYGHFCVKRDLMRGDGSICETGRGPDCMACARTRYGNTKTLLTFAATGMGLRQLSGVDAFIAVSKFVSEQSAPYMPDRPVHIIPNFIDPMALAKSRDRQSQGHLPRRFVLFVGVLVPFKGVDDLIEAFKLARERNAELEDVELMLMGRQHPSASYTSDPRNKITVMHNPPRGMVVEAIYSCWFMVVPSRGHDACPTTVLEGVAAGKQVIGTRAGGIPELLEDIEGAVIVPPSDPEALAAAIEAVCARQTTGYQGMQDLNPVPPGYMPLHPERVIAETVEVYGEVVARRSNIKQEKRRVS